MTQVDPVPAAFAALQRSMLAPEVSVIIWHGLVLTDISTDTVFVVVFCSDIYLTLLSCPKFAPVNQNFMI